MTGMRGQVTREFCGTLWLADVLGVHRLARARFVNAGAFDEAELPGVPTNP